MILITGGAYQGKGDFAKSLGIAEDKILFNAHEIIKEMLAQGRDAAAEFDKLLCGIDAVTCDEIGMGIVPLNPKEREWREVTGRIMCETAKKADTVYRLVCGIAVKIKG